MKRLYVWDDGSGCNQVVVIAHSVRHAHQLANLALQKTGCGLELDATIEPNKVVDLGASWAGCMVITCPGLRKDRIYREDFGFTDAIGRGVLVQ